MVTMPYERFVEFSFAGFILKPDPCPDSFHEIVHYDSSSLLNYNSLCYSIHHRPFFFPFRKRENAFSISERLVYFAYCIILAAL